MVVKPKDPITYVYGTTAPIKKKGKSRPPRSKKYDANLPALASDRETVAQRARKRNDPLAGYLKNAMADPEYEAKVEERAERQEYGDMGALEPEEAEEPVAVKNENEKKKSGGKRKPKPIEDDEGEHWKPLQAQDFDNYVSHYFLEKKHNDNESVWDYLDRMLTKGYYLSQKNHRFRKVKLAREGDEHGNHHEFVDSLEDFANGYAYLKQFDKNETLYQYLRRKFDAGMFRSRKTGRFRKMPA